MSSATTQEHTKPQQHEPPAEAKPARKRSKVKWAVIAILALAVAYALFDLYGPRSTKLHRFDAHGHVMNGPANRDLPLVKRADHKRAA